MKIGEMLQEIRINKGLSLREVAEAIGIEKSNLSKIEHGKYKNLSCEKLLKFTEFYKISPLYLLGLEGTTEDIEPKWILLIQKLKEENITAREVIKAIEKDICKVIKQFEKNV